MRLISALWEEFHPFDTLPGVSDCLSIDDPDDLMAGDVLIVHGGGDIHPSLYGKGRSSMSGASRSGPDRRDTIEWALMQRATQLGVPIIGICRGAQMLCALAGGFLIQHVNGHSGMHHVRTNQGDIIQVNSIHHQMMQPQGTVHELMAWAKTSLSDVYYDEDNLVQVDIEPEYIYFNEIKGYAPQWHPEMLSVSHPANKYILQHIKDTL